MGWLIGGLVGWLACYCVGWLGDRSVSSLVGCFLRSFIDLLVSAQRPSSAGVKWWKTKSMQSSPLSNHTTDMLEENETNRLYGKKCCRDLRTQPQ